MAAVQQSLLVLKLKTLKMLVNILFSSKSYNEPIG